MGDDLSRSRDRLSRLFLWLDQRLAQFERQAAVRGDAPSDPARQEREARALMSLVRVYEKLVEMKERLDERQEGGERKERDGPDSAAARRLCEALADRIERLQGQAGGTEPAGRLDGK